MSYNGNRGSYGGGRGGGRGGFGGGGRQSFGGRGAQIQTGPPNHVLEMGRFVHACEGDMVYEATLAQKIPYFNSQIYFQDKQYIGKVDEIFGPMNQVYFTVKPENGIVATSFKKGDLVYITADKLLPLERFLPKPKAAGPKRGGARRGGAAGGGGARGFGTPRGRGGFRGGRGGFTPNRGSFGRGGGRGGGGFRGQGNRSFSGRGRGGY